MAERGQSSQHGAAGAATERLGGKVADAADRVESRAKDGDLGGIVDEVKGTAGELKDAAVEQGRHFFESAKGQATGFADQRKDDVAQSVSDIAASLRETGKQFDERPNIRAFVGGAADGLDQLAVGLRERSFADIYADVEDYARRSPLTVGAVAAVVGFMVARLVKASSDDLAESGATARASARRAASRRRPASASA